MKPVNKNHLKFFEDKWSFFGISVAFMLEICIFKILILIEIFYSMLFTMECNGMKNLRKQSYWP